MSTETTLTAMQNKNQQIAPAGNFEVGFTSSGSFDLMQRAAKMIASSSLIPKEYQGNIPNCAIALEMSIRIGCGYLQVMQNLDVVHGRPAWRAKFLIGTVNTCGRFTALRYEFFGEEGNDSWGCRAWATEKATDEKLFGPKISIQLAKDEGWYGKNGSKWKSIPQKMLMYRAGAWWSDLYAPELALGLHTVEEAHDFIDVVKTDDGSFSVNLENLRETTASSSKLDAFAGATVDAETGEIIPAKELHGLIGKLKATTPAQRIEVFLNENGQELFEKAGSTPETAKSLADLGIRVMIEEAA